ncbi:alpha/beta hydrolase [Pelagibacterium lentulum]|uniref:Alpha/beta hydrolase n=1 Tax=Pelagibacterium lentulum TaxID=2029865 RepID=A0A916RLJ0_9HYPH|nr:alpha/beta hydrolase [Pelagibacterium lentulum]GGA58385.1 alpha/beta hydrolase [Pelagibacterium lentulum]
MIRRIVFGTLGVLAVAYMGVVAYLYFNQRAFFFVPDGDVWEIADVGLDAELVSIPTTNDETVTGWYGAPSPGMPTILYLKGNSGSFTSEYARFQAFSEDGFGFLSIDYRGFPLSPGQITQQNILDDALAAFDWLAEREDQILIWGRSLGSSPAVWVASQRDSDALVLETPFYSAVAVAAERYPYAPVGFLMMDQFPSNEWIGDVEEPLFIAHGTADVVITHGNGERLFAEAPNPFEIWIEDGAGHNDMWARGIWERTKQFYAAALQ